MTNPKNIASANTEIQSELTPNPEPEPKRASKPAPEAKPGNSVHPPEAEATPKTTSEGSPEPDMPPPTSEPMTPAKVSRFRISGTNYVAKTKQVLTTVLLMSPPSSEFIRVHPDPAMSLVTRVLKSNREFYLIEPDIYPEIEVRVPDFYKHAGSATLRPYQTKAGQFNLWPLKMENPYSVGSNSWNLSAFNAAQECEKRWLRVYSNQAVSQWCVQESEEVYPDPEWPNLGIDELVDMASRVNVISSIDHPYIKMLRGILS
jgi:hypothetical protein